MVRFFLVLIGVCLLSVFSVAQDTSKNVNSLIAKELSVVPTIDGDVSDAAWADIPEIQLTGSGDSPAPTEPGDLDFFMRAGWDDETNALYFAFRVVDDHFVNMMGKGSSFGDSNWKMERMEFVTNGANTGLVSDGEDSDYHTQFIFDLANTVDPQPGGILDLPVSSSFVSIPVYEGIDGSIQAIDLPYNLSDDYVQSAAKIRVTGGNPEAWGDAAVEWILEMKLVIFNKLTSTGMIGYDTADEENIATGYKSFFEDPANEIRNLQPNDVIGISPQQNDADIYDISAEREHQVNSTNRPENWNSSAELTGLILAPAVVAYHEHWSQMQ